MTPPMTRYLDRLNQAWDTTRSLLCVGLDPEPSKFPAAVIAGTQDLSAAIEQFCCQIVDATADLACAYKPQIAYFAAQGAETALLNIIRYIRQRAPHAVIVLDAKRGDIGSTAEQYAREAFERFDADAVTLNPYMGSDTIAPFLAWKDRGVFVLCRTSNPGGDEFQMLNIDGEPLYQRVARTAAQRWNDDGQAGLVVGATYPREIAAVRALVGDMPLLVPGIGAQGGDLAATLQAGLTAQRTGLLINSSRAILYAGKDQHYAAAARDAAQQTCAQIRELSGL